jgi:hypothetical protein
MRTIWKDTILSSGVSFLKKGVVASLIFCGAATPAAQAQDLVKPFLRKLEYYKYANVSIFEADANAMKRVKEVFTPSLQRPSSLDNAEQECTNTDEIKKRIQKKQPVPKTLIEEGGSPQDCEAVQSYYQAAASMVQIGKVYVIAERYADGQEPNILGIVSIEGPKAGQPFDNDALRNALNAPISAGVLDAADLRQMKTKQFEKNDSTGAMQEVSGSISGTTFENMYDYLKAMIKQNPQEMTSKIRPNQAVAMKINKEVVTKMIGEDNVGDYLMISEGEPHKASNEGTFLDEVVVGVADLISWRHYEDPNNSKDGEPNGLPKYGAELRYGLDDLGYPSLWSERVAVNALWGAQKLGVILPSSLWSPQITPIFAERKFTTLGGGIGINGSFDFPFKLIDRSGVFNFSGSGLFGNNIAPARHGQAVGDIRDSAWNNYLIRAHFQGNYTFAIGINDPDNEEQKYFIRFKIGGAAYWVEEWLNRNGVMASTYNFRRFVPSLLARLEFMSSGLSVPFGSYIQFFDGVLAGNVWLQVPIAEQGFFTGIRLDCKVSAPVTRAPYPWEVQTVIFPSARFIFRW